MPAWPGHPELRGTGSGPLLEVMEDFVMRREMNIMAMAKGGERYVFLYDDESHDALVQVFDKFARNVDLNFSERDAAFLREKVRESLERQALRRFTRRGV